MVRKPDVFVHARVLLGHVCASETESTFDVPAIVELSRVSIAVHYISIVK